MVVTSEALNTNGISMASEFSAGLTNFDDFRFSRSRDMIGALIFLQTDGQTDRPRYSLVYNRRHLPTTWYCDVV